MCLKPPLIQYFHLAFGWKSRNVYSSPPTAVEIPAHLHNVSCYQTSNQNESLYCISHIKSKTSPFTTVLDLNICFFNLFLNVTKWAGWFFEGFLLWIYLQLIEYECKEDTLNVQEIYCSVLFVSLGFPLFKFVTFLSFPFSNCFPTCLAYFWKQINE